MNEFEKARDAAVDKYSIETGNFDKVAGCKKGWDGACEWFEKHSFTCIGFKPDKQSEAIAILRGALEQIKNVYIPEVGAPVKVNAKRIATKALSQVKQLLSEEDL